MVQQKLNSVIFKDVNDDANFSDISAAGTNGEYREVTVNQDIHGLSLGDAVYYNIYTNRYARALATNTIMSEVIGLVSDVPDENTFTITMKGVLLTDRYNAIADDSIMYLSSAISGRLTNTEPANISKIIGRKIPNGIDIDIQRGYHLKSDETPVYTGIKYYTQSEIQDIINTVMKDIY